MGIRDRAHAVLALAATRWTVGVWGPQRVALLDSEGLCLPDWGRVGFSPPLSGAVAIQGPGPVTTDAVMVESARPYCPTLQLFLPRRPSGRRTHDLSATRDPRPSICAWRMGGPDRCVCCGRLDHHIWQLSLQAVAMCFSCRLQRYPACACAQRAAAPLLSPRSPPPDLVDSLLALSPAGCRRPTFVDGYLEWGAWRAPAALKAWDDAPQLPWLHEAAPGTWGRVPASLAVVFQALETLVSPVEDRSSLRAWVEAQLDLSLIPI